MEEILKRINFLKTALTDREVAAIAPSSKYVVKDVLDRISPPLETIIEYGPGEGVLTKELLGVLSPRGKYLAVESNSYFAQTLQRNFPDRRLKVVTGKAQDIFSDLEKHGIQKTDLVVASIPFGFLAPQERIKLVQDSHDIMAPGSFFIIFNQYSPMMHSQVKKVFGSASTFFEFRNLPPCFIISAKKSIA